MNAVDKTTQALANRQVVIPSGVLRALLKFTSVCDVRQQLNNINIETTATGLRAWASNGHIAGIYTEGNFDADAERQSLLVDAADLKKLLKKRLKRLDNIAFQPCAESDEMVVVGSPVVNDKAVYGAAHISPLKPYNLDKLLIQCGHGDGNVLGLIDADYLLSMTKINQLLVGYDAQPPRMTTFGDKVASCINFPDYPNFFALIMPMRPDSTIEVAKEAAFICPTQVLKSKYTYHDDHECEWFDTAGDALRAYKEQCDANGEPHKPIQIKVQHFTEPYDYMMAKVEMLDETSK